MEMKWHRLELRCSKCKQEPLITDISASADGELIFEMACCKCGTALIMRTTGIRMAAQALFKDIEEELAKKNPKQRLLKPPPPPKVEPNPKANGDKKFLRSLGINPDEKDPEPQNGGVE